MTNYSKKIRTIKEEPVLKHMSWCIKNDITIVYQPDNKTNGRVIINDKGEEFVGEEVYKGDNTLYRRKKVKGEKPQQTYSERIYELYTIKYNEYNGKKE